MNSFERGHKAEAVAATYLERHGYVIVDRNWRTRWCEIDIVAQKEHCMYFVEVKYRRYTQNGTGLEYITSKKLSQMIRAAESWVQANTWNQEYNLLAVEVRGVIPAVYRAVLAL